jgi:hypothetical protein
MTALFQLVAEYRSAAEKLADLDLDEQTIADTLDAMAGEVEVKAANVAYMVRNLEVTAEALKEFEKAQKARREAIERRADRLKDYIGTCLQQAGIHKVEAAGVVLSFRKSSAVVINEPGLIPAEFMRQPEPPPPAPDKKAISDAIKAGREVPGAHIEEHQNLQIK